MLTALITLCGPSVLNRRVSVLGVCLIPRINQTGGP